MNAIPGYWMHETSGELSRIVKAYLNGATLEPPDITLMRDYLRQWVAAFPGDEARELEARVEFIVTTDSLRNWLRAAIDAGIDPL